MRQGGAVHMRQQGAEATVMETRGEVGAGILGAGILGAGILGAGSVGAGKVGAGPLEVSSLRMRSSCSAYSRSSRVSSHRQSCDFPPPQPPPPPLTPPPPPLTTSACHPLSTTIPYHPSPPPIHYHAPPTTPTLPHPNPHPRPTTPRKQSGDGNGADRCGVAPRHEGETAHAAGGSADGNASAEASSKRAALCLSLRYPTLTPRPPHPCPTA